MSNYKDIFYTKYVSSHIVTRKGEATIDEFKNRAVVYQKQFGRFLPEYKSANIIDIGCGNGSIVWWLQKRGFIDTRGVDISLEQIETGKKLGVKNLEQSGMKKVLKDKQGFFDVIIARDILEHFNKEEIVELLSLCGYSLKNKGIIIIQAPNAESPFFGRIRYGDFTHEIAFSASALLQLLNIVGFDKIEFYPMGPVITGLKSTIRVLLWKVVEAIYKSLIFIESGRGNRIVSQNIIVVATKTLDVNS